MTMSSARPKLILRLQAAHLPPETWEVTDTPLGIGRLDSADIAVPDKSVSRQHARILPTPTGFEVEDLGSVNGTWLNDRQITDRTALANGDRLMVGDVPLAVEVHQPAPVIIETMSPPPPAGGPSTVFYPIDEALAAARPADFVVEDATLIEDDATAAPPPPPPPVVITPPTRPADFVPAFERPTPPPPPPPPPPLPPPVDTGPAFERPTPPPPPPPVDTGPAFERPTPPPPPPTDVVPAFERPTPIATPPPPSRAPAIEAQPDKDLSATELIALADQLATSLRVFKGDAGLALWLFNHAGGQPAVEAFSQQVQRAQRDPAEAAALLQMAPQASQLLQAAVLLANVISTLGPHTPPDDEAQANASHLQPVPRA